MGLLLIVLGIVLWLLGFSLVGAICFFIGLILLFVPGTYGYTDWRGRRGL